MKVIKVILGSYSPFFKEQVENINWMYYIKNWSRTTGRVWCLRHRRAQSCRFRWGWRTSPWPSCGDAGSRGPSTPCSGSTRGCRSSAPDRRWTLPPSSRPPGRTQPTPSPRRTPHRCTWERDEDTPWCHLCKWPPLCHDLTDAHGLTDVDRAVHEVVVDDDVLQSERWKQKCLLYTHETYKHPDVCISIPLHAEVLLIIVQHGAILCHHVVLEKVMYHECLPIPYKVRQHCLFYSFTEMSSPLA